MRHAQVAEPFRDILNALCPPPACPTCKGDGWREDDENERMRECFDCRGSGTVTEEVAP